MLAGFGTVIMKTFAISFSCLEVVLGSSFPSLNVRFMIGVDETNPKNVEFGSVGAVKWKVSPLSSDNVAVKEGTP